MHSAALVQGTKKVILSLLLASGKLRLYTLGEMRIGQNHSNLFCKKVSPHFWLTRSLSAEGNGTCSGGASPYNNGGRLVLVRVQHSCLCLVYITYAVTPSSSGHSSPLPSCTTLVTQGISHSYFLLPLSANDPISPQIREATP